VFVGGIGPFPDDSTWCGACDESSNTMKPYYLKNAGEYHSRLTTKLAVLLLALPITGAFAAYDYTSVLDTTTTFSSNTVTSARLTASNVTAVGTASNLNESNIGWSVSPTAQVALEWTGSAVVTTSGAAGALVVGGADVASSTASSSYNTLTIDDYVSVTGTSLTIGNGALNSSGSTTIVDTTKLANSNAVTVTGAAYSSSMLSTTLTLSTGAITVGNYGNSNSLSVLAGGKVTASAGALVVGASDTNNLTSGSSNAVTISGKTSVDILSGTVTTKSTLTSVGATIGNYGSSNTVTISDSGVLAVGGALALGVNGSSNTMTVTGGTISGATTVTLGNTGDSNVITASSTSAITASGAVLAGNMPAATGNGISLSGSTFTGGATTIGNWGSSNALALASSSTLTVSSLTVGYGDNAVETSSGANDAADGTAGRVASEGSSNTLSVSASKVITSGAISIGVYGSSNVATVSGSSVYATWTDAAHGSVAADSAVQLDEITGVSSISVGTGLAATAALGSSNSLTFSAASVFASADDLTVGDQGSSNTVAINGASQGKLTDDLIIGLGNTSTAAQGSSNAVSLAGASALTVGGDLYLGTYGSSNTLTVGGGSTVTVTGTIASFGLGVESTTSATGNNAFGSTNVLTVTGTGSALTITGTTAVVVGDFGSSNDIVVAAGATATVNATTLTLGNWGTDLGTVINPNRKYSQDNTITVSGGSTLTLAGALTLGVKGIDNSLTVTGSNSVADASHGKVIIGQGATGLGSAFGSGNSALVSDEAVLLAQSLYLGYDGTTAYSASENTLTVESDAIVVVGSTGFGINNTNGSQNYVQLKDGGMIAFLGKYKSTDVTWNQYIVTGATVSVTGSVSTTITSLVDQGLIKVWDSTTGAYVTATSSDVEVNYYATATEAEAATGYSGLAGYSVLSVKASVNSLAWAGTPLYDAGNNVYCSSWYGWFYNDATYGDFIMSYNDYSWQYVAPTNTVDSCYFYDYGLAAWIYTDQTYMQNKWYYNYATAAWAQFN